MGGSCAKFPMSGTPDEHISRLIEKRFRGVSSLGGGGHPIAYLEDLVAPQLLLEELFSSTGSTIERR
jgi:hypothetical protein